ncbi:aldolase/citrate lyase family protein [Clostridioides sp. ES-S-0005-03]|uniref:aldolase/citrate lyase family protein n=1 Tax=Clostridioides sp. ES-S-0005-03 TaxID=2770774 RepID=UPI001D12E161
MGTDIIGFPFINTVQDAQKAVSVCTYPPKGIRGCNPQRASYYERMNYLNYIKNADKETLKMMLIEQKSGYDNLEEIVQVDGYISCTINGAHYYSFSLHFSTTLIKTFIRLNSSDYSVYT